MMLHRMSEVRGWGHTEMMKMPKRLFYRYYGYWYQDRLREQDQQEEEKRKADLERKQRDSPRQWK